MGRAGGAQHGDAGQLVDAIEPVAAGCEHISLMQGYKVYGAHLGPFKTPARENDPPHMPPEFNVDQQQFLEQRQRGKAWTWSAIRPSVVCGFALGNPMNLALVIAVYASISQGAGLPLRFPGQAGAYDEPARDDRRGPAGPATVWAATDRRAPTRRSTSTTATCSAGARCGRRSPTSSGSRSRRRCRCRWQVVMADKEPLWNAMVAASTASNRHAYSGCLVMAFGDFVFSWDYDMFADGSKARRLGFHDYVDTTSMFIDTFADLRRRRIIP